MGGTNERLAAGRRQRCGRSHNAADGLSPAHIGLSLRRMHLCRACVRFARLRQDTKSIAGSNVTAATLTPTPSLNNFWGSLHASIMRQETSVTIHYESHAGISSDPYLTPCRSDAIQGSITIQATPITWPAPKIVIAPKTWRIVTTRTSSYAHAPQSG